jgi:hypothetical protein
VSYEGWEGCREWQPATLSTVRAADGATHAATGSGSGAVRMTRAVAGCGCTGRQGERAVGGGTVRWLEGIVKILRFAQNDVAWGMAVGASLLLRRTWFVLLEPSLAHIYRLALSTE